MSELNRRDFVVAAIGAVCAGCMCEFAEGAAPPSSQSGQMSGTVDIGTKADYPKDGFISDKFIKSNQVVVAREDGKIYAMTAICTHRRATVSVKGAEIVCAKHGSHFSGMGTPTKGPAKISLMHFAIKEEKGRLIVDKSKQFEEKKWDDPAASVSA